MRDVLPLVTYGSIAVFLTAVTARFLRIKRLPLNVRWELYPVPHEGKRSEHGGSRAEESDWWTKEHRPDRVNQLKHMILEMVFIKALRERNPRLWRVSFPFHFGLYLIAGFAALVVALALLGLLDVAVPRQAPPLVGWLGVLGMALTGVGGLGLLAMRLTDPDLRPYTTFAHIFNLLFILAAVALVFVGLYVSGWDVAPYAAFAAGLLTGQLTAPEAEPVVQWSILMASVLLAYIPLTHMSHFFVKWFTWDKIRWDDEPNVRGGRIEELINESLTYPVSWSGAHIRGDGKKSWADVATEELKSK